ncbi:transcriptional regulator, XRE family protein [Haloferula helveola]|uniref:Transcriptional regulator, XRE family protein n=1 Tax=Haloferula helveola TaxID=490095 RepID=A0ABN6H8A4_9BACT|nr:transcriptional regulator, XRE family protein [Haloferula helveola]
MKEEEADTRVAEIVSRLKARRESLGMSLSRLSELAGMSHVGILQIESGERSPQLRTIIKLAAALDLKLAKLFSGLD